jgi:ABC-type sugar transport system substrate-binding protein
MTEEFVASRRQLLAGAGLVAIASQVGLAATARAADAKRKLIWVPQALGDWDTAFQVGAKDFCELVGWDYQRTGNPVYSVENHVEQVNNAIAAKADVILTEIESPGLVPPSTAASSRASRWWSSTRASRRKPPSSASASSIRTSSTPASSTAPPPRPSPRS